SCSTRRSTSSRALVAVRASAPSSTRTKGISPAAASTSPTSKPIRPGADPPSGDGAVLTAAAIDEINTSVSLSASTTSTHANGGRSAAAHWRRSVVLPYPAGARRATRVVDESASLCNIARRATGAVSGRATVPAAGTRTVPERATTSAGGTSLVTIHGP